MTTMETAVINIKIDSKTKIQAQRVAAGLGFSLSSLINGYLRQLIRVKAISFNLTNEEPSEYLVQALKESEADRKTGRFTSFRSADEALGFLDKIIDENKKN